MSARTIGIAQGAAALEFDVIDHRDIGAVPHNIAKTTAARGDLMYYTGKNEVSIASGGVGAAGQYAGFCESEVVESMEGRFIQFHAYLALKDTDQVAIWNVGRFRIVNVDGVVADNDLVYPGPAGSLSATQTGSDPAVGVCREGNGGVADDPIIVEINLLGA